MESFRHGDLLGDYRRRSSICRSDGDQVDLWDDPRSLTTFRTFSRPNGCLDQKQDPLPEEEDSETSFSAEKKFEKSDCSSKLVDHGENTVDSGYHERIDSLPSNGTDGGHGKSNGMNHIIDGSSMKSGLQDSLEDAEDERSSSPGSPYVGSKLPMSNHVHRGSGQVCKEIVCVGRCGKKCQCSGTAGGMDKQPALTSFGKGMVLEMHWSSPKASREASDHPENDDAHREEESEADGHDRKENGKVNGNSDASENELDDAAQEVAITLSRSDRRFGFSVVGGCDEGFGPRIEEITPGSPADRADLEVGDEILEVNGRSLDNCTHTEVISHIHQCIRSRTICLRVKRKTSCKLALDLARNSNVQDAFVIAVEQQARERLEKLSALKKIKPVDMTKLSQELNECTHSTPELNGVIENNPIYVTTVPEIHNATLERVKKDQLNNSEHQYDPDALSQDGKEQGILGTNGHSDLVSGEPEGNDQELELKQEILDGKDTCEELVSPSSPETPPRERLLIDPQNGNDCVSVSFSQECVSVETLLKNLPDKNKLSDDKEPKLNGKLLPNVVSGTSQFSDAMEFEHGQHREMAVDVPDSFVGVSKTAPRYPPPKSSEIPNNSLSRRKESPEHSLCNSVVKSPVSDSRIVQETDTQPQDAVSLYSVNNAIDSKVVCNVPRTSKLDTSEMNGVTSDDITMQRMKEEQLERIRKYQDDIRRRKEAEERQAQEEEFLRTSLRGSKKLQALEDNPPQPPRRGVVNTAFELEEGDTGTLPAGHQVSPGRLVGAVEGTDGKEPPELARTFGASDLLHSLYRLGSTLKGNGHKDEDLLLIESLIRNADFQNILAVHNKVQEVCCFSCPPTPVCTEAQDITQEVMNSLQESTLPESAELLDILSKFEIEGLMYSHDKIAERQVLPTVTPDEELLDRASQYTEESVKIVRIDKTSEPLGATVRNEGEAVIIGRIVKGGAAEKSGLLHEGDEILEVNGVEMRGKSVNDVCDILATMTGTLTFLIIPTQYEPSKGLSRDIVMHVKAHFDYDPDDDLYIPCRELGISFQKGDILHVINQDDPNWWQAFREGEEDQALAGLVPSKNFQQQREAMKQTIVGETNNKEKTKKGKFLCAKKHHKKKKKKIMYNANFNDEFDGDQVLTYEEVALYYPRANRKRPTVLIGPPNIGRHELRQRLMEDTERFAAAVPHTSRTKRDPEVDGVDYHFITRSQFEADILGGKFVEHGEYEKNYYGTSLDAIRAVVNSGKICVLNLHPQSLKILKNSDLKPYVVFVAPPSLEKLRQNRIKMGASAKDEELKDIIEKAREMEESYGHYFDMVIINSDIDKAYNELLKEINTLEREPQWVPAAWLKNDTN